MDATTAYELLAYIDRRIEYKTLTSTHAEDRDRADEDNDRMFRMLIADGKPE